VNTNNCINIFWLWFNKKILLNSCNNVFIITFGAIFSGLSLDELLLFYHTAIKKTKLDIKYYYNF